MGDGVKRGSAPFGGLSLLPENWIYQPRGNVAKVAPDAFRLFSSTPR